MERLRHGHVEPAGEDLLLGLPVVGGLDELDGQAEVAEYPVALGDYQREVVGVDEPLQTQPDGSAA